MSDAPSTMVSEEPHLSFFGKVAAWCSLALAAWIFLTIGWLAVEPDDPLGPVSLLTRGGPLTMLLQAGGLAGVTAALATVIAGRQLVDVGTFAAAFGLALVSLRGDTAGYLLLQSTEVSSSGGAGLVFKLAGESLAWLAVALVSTIVSAVVMRWCFGQSSEHRSGSSHSVTTRTLAGYDIPWVGATLLGDGDHRTERIAGVKHTIVVTVAGLLAFAVLSAGLSTRSIQHGQACFVVVAAVCTGCYLAYRVAPVQSALWSMIAVGLIAVLGYLWASIQPAASAMPPGAAKSAFLRVLPIQYIFVGTATAVAMSWYMHHPVEREESAGPQGSRDTSPKEVG